MSFSADVKEELSNIISSARHCQMAELAAFVGFCAIVKDSVQDGRTLTLITDNELVKSKFFSLLNRTYGTDSEKSLSGEICKSFLEGLRAIDEKGDIHLKGEPVSSILLKQSCCKRAYLRGAYLCAGSMSDPKRSYHLEIVCDSKPQADQIIEVISSFDLEAKTTKRKDKYVVYIKESSAIVDFLGICEAHVALMEMENDRIVKEVRNTVNRRVNCEAANISKTINASTRQIEDIEYLRDNYGFNRLPDNLREMALIRLEFPDATLPELGAQFDPPLGKSGVNHRLRRLSELADKERLHQ